MKADRVRYDPRTGDVLATGTVDARIGGRRVRAERLEYRAGTRQVELANLLLEGIVSGDAGAHAYVRARGNGKGGVATPMPPCLPASSRLGIPWLQAARAEARDDLSRIRGRHGVKIGAGAIEISGQAFDLDPEASRLIVTLPQVRLRSPRARLEALKLRASLAKRGDARGSEIAIELEGEVLSRLELPYPLASGEPATVLASCDRLEARPRAKGAFRFVLSGEPARIAVPEAGLELSAPRVSGRIRGRRVVLQGELAGRLEVQASAFAERDAVRRSWVVTRASALELLPRTTRPAWWFGEPEAQELPRRLILRDVLVEGDRSPRPELVLYRPNW